jgi:hypothetical protein
VRRSLPSLAEHIGRDCGHCAESSEDYSRQVQQGVARLRARGRILVVRESHGRPGRGRGYAHHYLLSDRFERRREPNTPLAYWAARRMSIQVSPLGPSLEQTYLRTWWLLDANCVRTRPLTEWAEQLGLSRATALRRLRALDTRARRKVGKAGVGITFEELPPEARQEGDVGRKPKLYRVTAELPPKGRLPDGAARHREHERGPPPVHGTIWPPSLLWSEVSVPVRAVVVR